jgi:hypothetical protein
MTYGVRSRAYRADGGGNLAAGARTYSAITALHVVTDGDRATGRPHGAATMSSEPLVRLKCAESNRRDRDDIVMTGNDIDRYLQSVEEPKRARWRNAPKDP